jgi:hypothetical protein
LAWPHCAFGSNYTAALLPPTKPKVLLNYSVNRLTRFGPTLNGHCNILDDLAQHLVGLL